MRRVLFCAIVAIFSCQIALGQFSMSANLQTNHLWRGGEVADGVVVTSDASYKMFGESLQLGVWGGINIQGTYKEFNYFATYSIKGFSLSLWDTYNFAEYATYNNEEFFNYNASTTGRFLDATLAYQFSGKFPLRLCWSTILFGRDRNSENSANRYSTFVYGEYPVYNRQKWRFDIGLGGAFALNAMGERATFYGDEPGLVHISTKLTYDLKIRDYHMPISISTMMNPQSGKAYLQLAAQLFSF